MGQDAEGRPVKLESYRLAASEADFWREAAHPRRMATVHGERFTEYLKRVMLQAAPLAAPKDVAWFLASYARDAKATNRGWPIFPPCRCSGTPWKKPWASSSRAIKASTSFAPPWCRRSFTGCSPPGCCGARKYPPTDRQARFRWHETVWYLHVPMIRALFEQLATPAKLGSLGLVEVLDWTETALSRVDRASFFASFEEGHAVQYFYEPFLEAFDPELRKDLGVWYTPPEIVQYMVARVDKVLRDELDIADGLADPRVYVLDPCCGTGAYLVEVLKRITGTLQEKGGDALIGHDVKQAALSRVFGFEILPAPFVVAHLQVGLYLQNLRAPLIDDTKERAGVYLTNALTGWEPPQGPKQHLIFPELEAERDAAEEVKRDKPILVILGNPPYNAFAGVSAAAEKSLVEPYKEGLVFPVGHQEIQSGRPLYSLFRPGGTPHCRDDRKRRGQLYLQFFLPERSLFFGHAPAFSFRVRRPLVRLPERRQPGDRQAHPGRQARPQRLFHGIQPGGYPGGHRRLPDGAQEQRRDRPPLFASGILGGDQAGRLAGKPQDPGF